MNENFRVTDLLSVNIGDVVIGEDFEIVLVT